jgi:hypothetical protein
MPESSCYITVENKLNVDLNFVSKNAVHGSWAKEPDEIIKAGSKAECQLKGAPGEHRSV